MNRRINRQTCYRALNEYNVFIAGPRKGEPRTLVDRITRFLVAGLGTIEVQPEPEGKYRRFRSPVAETPYYYYVGKAGAVKAGETASKSTSITKFIRKVMTEWESSD